MTNTTTILNYHLMQLLNDAQKCSYLNREEKKIGKQMTDAA